MQTNFKVLNKLKGFLINIYKLSNAQVIC
jgi:hypothetical protein